VKRATSGEPTGGPGSALRGGSRGDASARSSYDFAHRVEDRQAVGHTWVTPHSERSRSGSPARISNDKHASAHRNAHPR
jgi:hypothetical protein